MPDALMGHHDAALGQDQLDVTQAQAEDVIQPHGVADDLGRETGAGDRTRVRVSCCQPRPAIVPVPAPANLTMPSKGFEQLASDKITMRLGGLYALEGVMNKSPEYHQPVLEALCAFVRDGTIGMIVNDKGPAKTSSCAEGDRKTPPGPGEIDLFGANIPAVILSDANLSEADLRGANLSGANLAYAKAGAVQSQRATLAGN